MKPRYCYLTYYSTAPAMRRILRGHMRSRPCLPAYLNATPIEAAKDVGPPNAAPLAVVRWTVQHRKDERGCHILSQPVIVGVLLPRAEGERQRWMRWGTRAKAILMASVRP